MTTDNFCFYLQNRLIQTICHENISTVTDSTICYQLTFVYFLYLIIYKDSFYKENNEVYINFRLNCVFMMMCLVKEC